MSGEMTLPHYLAQIDHAVESLREPENIERNQKIDAIQKRVRTYIEGITRVDTKQMKMAILAGLDEIAPEIEALVADQPGERPTWPSPEPQVETIPKSERRFKL